MSWFDRLLGLGVYSVATDNQTSNVEEQKSDFTAGFSREELKRYALDKIYYECHVPPIIASFGDTMEDVERGRDKVRRAREKYQNYIPVRLRREIFGWLDFYDHRISEGERDIKSWNSQKRLADLERRSRQQ